jgi:hypothetical protein
MENVRFDLRTPQPAEISPFLDKAGAQVTGTGDHLEVEFESATHLLAFDRATSHLSWSYSSRRPAGADGWEDWSDAGPDQREVGQPLLPAQFSTDDTAVATYEMVWVESADPAPPSLVRQLGLRSGIGKAIWTPVKIVWKYRDTIWKATKSWQFAAASVAGRIIWKELKQQSAQQHARLEVLEGQRRAALNLAELRRHRLESGTDSQRRKWRQHYSALDALIEANR